MVRNRLHETLASRGIPVSRMDIDYIGSSSSPGDEHFRVRLEMSEDQIIPASMALASTLAGIGTNGIGPDEYRTVREYALARMSRAMTNDERIRQCISSYLYGSDLATTATKAKFFSSRNIALDSELNLFNGYSKALVSNTENATVRWTGNPQTLGYGNYPALQMKLRYLPRPVSSFPVGWSPSLSRRQCRDSCTVWHRHRAQAHSWL